MAIVSKFVRYFFFRISNRYFFFENLEVSKIEAKRPKGVFFVQIFRQKSLMIILNFSLKRPKNNRTKIDSENL